jgi:hypothetical protein
MLRRSLIRLPTCVSVGFGFFLFYLSAIFSSPGFAGFSGLYFVVIPAHSSPQRMHRLKALSAGRLQYEFLIYLLSIRPQPLPDPSCKCEQCEGCQDREADEPALFSRCDLPAG